MKKKTWQTKLPTYILYEADILVIMTPDLAANKLETEFVGQRYVINGPELTECLHCGMVTQYYGTEPGSHWCDSLAREHSLEMQKIWRMHGTHGTNTRN